MENLPAGGAADRLCVRSPAERPDGSRRWKGDAVKGGGKPGFNQANGKQDPKISCW